jgi:hypothetical protein
MRGVCALSVKKDGEEKMNKIGLILLLSFIAAYLAAQTEPEWLWAQRAGDDGWELAQDIVCDAAGNVYVTGYYNGAVQFGSFYTDSGTDDEIFVVKLDRDGNYLWAQHAGSEYNDSAEDIAIDAAGNVYITGWFQDVATFGSLGVVTEGSGDIFIAKLDPDGNWLYVNGAGGLQGDHGYSITVGPEGHVFVAGSFYEEAFFGDYSIECDFLNDIFIAEADENGNWLWVETAGGPNTETCWDLVADTAGNCYMAGYFSPETNFGSIHLTTAGPYDSFVAKINDGAWQWAIQVGSNQMDEAKGIALDNAGNLLVAGFMTGPATFGGTTLTPFGDWDIYLGKLSPDGNWIWAVNAGGEDYDEAFDVAVDIAGNSFVTGSIEGTVTFGSHVYPTGWTTTNLFIAKADQDGNWLWAARAPGYVVVGLSVAADATGRSYTCGYFSELAYFGDITLENTGNVDLLIAGLSPEGTALDDPQSSPVPTALHCYPQPGRISEPVLVSIPAPIPEGSELLLCNIRGQVVFRQALTDDPSDLEIPTNGLTPGIYLLQLRGSSSKVAQKIVLTR